MKVEPTAERRSALSAPNHRKKASRTMIVARRWIDVLFAGAAGAAALLLALYWSLTFRPRYLVLLTEAPYWVFLAAGVCLLALVFRVGMARWAAFLGLRHFLTYPPLWLGAMAGLAAVIAIFPAAFGNQIRLPAFLATQALNIAGATAIVICAFLIAPALVMLSRRERILPPAGSEPGDDAPFAFGSFEELRAWVSSDDPVTAMEKDIFHHGRIAKRIAARLALPNPPSQAVVGRLGAGKTTLLHLVRGHLRLMGADRQIRVVAAELWPYETSRAAVQGVIRTLVDELSKEVNVVGIRGIAAEYAEAMSAAGGIWSALARLQGIPTNPNDALAVLDDVATAIGIRMVVWIEDLERFAGGSTGVDEERLNPIRSLLYGLDKLRSIAVITATTSLHQRFDIEKIARFVESIPDIPEQETAKILVLFRKSCAERADIIDPAPSRAREPLQHLADEGYFAIRRSILGHATHTIADAVTGLCTTPRTLKQALRICIESWDKLAGEIDFDDLLVLSILRESEPESLSAIEDHLHHLREGWASEKERQGEALAWTNALAKAVPDDRRHALVNEAVDFLFKKDDADQRPQGVRQHNHADYWERYLALPELAPAQRDQPVLKILNTDDDSTFLRLFDDPKRASTIYDFRNLVSTERTVRLLLPLVEMRSHELAQDWPDNEPPGLVALWRLWLRAGEHGELKSPTVLEHVRKALDLAIPQNLTLAAEIEHYFVVPSRDVYELMPATDSDQAKKYLRAKLVATYDGRGAALAAGLRGAPSPVLLWLCWGLDVVRAHAMNGLPFEEWAKFRDTILEAGRSEPTTMLPQVAGMLVRDLALGRGVNYQFNEDAATRLFGGKEALREVFGRQDPTSWSDRPWVPVFLAAIAKPPVEPIQKVAAIGPENRE